MTYTGDGSTYPGQAQPPEDASMALSRQANGGPIDLTTADGTRIQSTNARVTEHFGQLEIDNYGEMTVNKGPSTRAEALAGAPQSYQQFSPYQQQVPPYQQFGQAAYPTYGPLGVFGNILAGLLSSLRLGWTGRVGNGYMSVGTGGFGSGYNSWGPQAYNPGFPWSTPPTVPLAWNQYQNEGWLGNPGYAGYNTANPGYYPGSLGYNTGNPGYYPGSLGYNTGNPGYYQQPGVNFAVGGGNGWSNRWQVGGTLPLPTPYYGSGS